MEFDPSAPDPSKQLARAGLAPKHDTHEAQR